VPLPKLPGNANQTPTREQDQFFTALVDWVEKGQAPADLEVSEQKVEAPSFATLRALPLCRWPAWPHYKSGPVTEASSFTCAP